jgi:hypothetical protein
LQKITLACDNLTNAQYFLKGVANIVEFEVIGLDGQLFQKGDTLSTIFFQNGILNHPIKRQLIIKNLTSVKVQYHWDVHNDQETTFQVDNKPEIFRIEPSQGEFPPLSSLSFDLFFSGIETVIIYFCFILFIFVVDSVFLMSFDDNRGCAFGECQKCQCKFEREQEIQSYLSQFPNDWVDAEKSD